MVGDVERHAFRLARDAGVAGRADEAVDERACRHLPGQRMLAPAGAEEQNVHKLQSLAGAPVAWQAACANRTRDLCTALDLRL